MVAGGYEESAITNMNICNGHLDIQTKRYDENERKLNIMMIKISDTL